METWSLNPWATRKSSLTWPLFSRRRKKLFNIMEWSWIGGSFAFSCGSAGKESAWNAGDPGLIPGLGRCPGEGKVYPLQYSGLENPLGSQSRTSLSDFYSFVPWRAFGNVWRHFWYSQLRRVPPSRLLLDILQWTHRIMPATNNHLV